MPEKIKRDSASDGIRVMAMLFVILVHVPFDGYPEALTIFWRSIYFMANGFFFLLSGKYHLRRSYETRQEYLAYYRKKFVSIVMPVLLYSAGLLLWKHGWKVLNWKAFTLEYARGLMDGSIYPHLWFVRPLTGMLISAPFLAKLMKGLKEQELKILIVIGLLWECIHVFWTKDILGTEFDYIGWFLDSWVLYFYLGYALDRIRFTAGEKKLIYLAGILCMVLTVLQGIYLSEHAYNRTDRSPFYIIAVSAAYLVLQEYLGKIGKYLGGAWSRIAGYSFGVYLIHYPFVLLYAGLLSGRSRSFWIYRLMVFACTLLSSLTVSFLVDNVVLRPMTKRLKKHG